ncbi:MAG TPA: undecaprenyl-diphosphatase UppP [Firmicutes bacterium]|nr:undecaprenyl-diphosphatase UppP [Bacillota bacterium]
MAYFEAFWLGAVQGLTEFLPVSSSGHLAVFPHIIASESELIHSLAFDVFIHGGTLLAVLFYFRKRIMVLASVFFCGLVLPEKRKNPDFKMAVYIVIATLPAVFAALLFKDFIESSLRGASSVGVNLIVFGILLFAADKIGKKKKGFYEIGMKAAAIIGVFQAIALMPGVSRSGITITAALFLGYARKDSAEFSFLLSIPAILGAFIFTLPELADGFGGNAGVLAVGFVVSAVSGFFAIKFMLGFVSRHSYNVFVIYRIMLGIFIILFIAGSRG